jgi:hypothetical protein
MNNIIKVLDILTDLNTQFYKDWSIDLEIEQSEPKNVKKNLHHFYTMPAMARLEPSNLGSLVNLSAK